MIQIIKDNYTRKAHDGEIQIAIEHLSSAGFEVIDVRRISRMVLLFGLNRTEIYYKDTKKTREQDLVISFLAHARDDCTNAMALGIRVGDYIAHHPEIFKIYRKS